MTIWDLESSLPINNFQRLAGLAVSFREGTCPSNLKRKWSVDLRGPGMYGSQGLVD